MSCFSDPTACLGSSFTFELPMVRKTTPATVHVPATLPVTGPTMVPERPVDDVRMLRDNRAVIDAGPGLGPELGLGSGLGSEPRPRQNSHASASASSSASTFTAINPRAQG